MTLKINYFGMIAEAMGEQQGQHDLTVNNVGELRAFFQNKLPGISFKVAVNQRIATDDAKLNEGDEIALLPPFAGG